MTEVCFIQPPERDGERADSAVAREAGELTRSAVQRLMAEGRVFVNGAAARKSQKLKAGDECRVELPEPAPADIKAEDIKIDVVYEDSELLVVDKPRGMVVHPAPGNYSGTLVNALMFHCGSGLSGINGELRPGIVHRIDKDTSGLLVVAKTDRAHLSLSEQIAAHSVEREYRAVNRGHFRAPEGTISEPIGRSRSDRKKRAVNGAGAKPAVTHYRVLTEYPGYTLTAFRLETGRTHQIRVHSAYVGHPVAGDIVYGGSGNDPGLGGQCLHAMILGFVHPATGEHMRFESPLPEYFTDFIAKIGGQTDG